MPEYLSPGVYVEEIELGPRPIEGVSTSTAGFLGETLRGPLQPRLMTGLEQYKRVYGGYTDNSFLTYAVEGFFKNGGQRCFIARITPDDAVAAVATHDTVNIEAIGPGIWGNRLAIKVGPGSLQDPTAAAPWDRIKLTVMYWDDMPPLPLVDPTDPANATDPNRRDPTLLEVYDNLSADPTSADFFQTRVNKSSNLVQIAPVDPDAPVNPTELPLTLLTDLGGTVGEDGSDVTLPDYQGRTLPPLPDDSIIRTGLEGFKEVDEISLLIAPDHHDIANLHSELITHCTLLADRFAILHSNPANDTLNTVPTLWPPQDTSYAAFYFPWIKVYDPRTNRDLLVPPSGHIAGIYAQTDVDRGVHKAPANVVVQGANGLQFQITKGEQDVLNPRGVNCLRVFQGRGLRVWGARTSSTNALWKYINVRRLFLFIEESIDEGTQWVVFEPNNEQLWARVKQSVTQFLTTVWRTGALMGTTAEEAFFVKADRTTMTQDDIDNGRLIVLIGVAPTKPAEFVIFRITQFTAGAETA
ncbi:MAG: phage tail sheath family protein [Calditrichaeota bacterium]|nr:phage tail sheath family protein [Calditrichota bacterium]MCB9088571.1 phage tail sheath family protein [Calditrichia bacterium]MCB0288624.1 phage tail sheath family protein [Calditrichota bacterium]MCB0294148.1 phage tail sheath family protein [Calditrichota bacterium]MCB0302452.1 phage tail sheath family protein [Calditrichota bacterium]